VKNPFALIHRSHTKKVQSSHGGGESPAAVHELAIDTFGGAIPNQHSSEYGQTQRSGGDSGFNNSQRIKPQLKIKSSNLRSPSEHDKTENVEHAFIKGQHIMPHSSTNLDVDRRRGGVHAAVET
jgi:hypothetical protein